MYFAVHPNPERCPSMFARPLLPVWLAKLKDWIDCMFVKMRRMIHKRA